MLTPEVMENLRAPQPFAAKLRDYYTLTKPEVNLLILMTTSAGYYLGNAGPFRLLGLLNTLVGTLLVASGTATLNQYMERAHDAQMRRTANRPLVSGRLAPAEALYFGLLLSLAGGVYLALTVNWLASALAVSTLLSYLLVYTPLKRRTPLCTLLGAIPGAMPTLIGWAGASGGLNRQAWFLFAVLFLWQFPHFLAIALMYREDYAHAGFKMLPDFDADGPLYPGGDHWIYHRPGDHDPTAAGHARLLCTLSAAGRRGGAVLFVLRGEAGRVSFPGRGKPSGSRLGDLPARHSWHHDGLQAGLNRRLQTVQRPHASSQAGIAGWNGRFLGRFRETVLPTGVEDSELIPMAAAAKHLRGENHAQA